MRSLFFIVAMTLLAGLSGAQAIEPVQDQQIIMYYEVPLGANSRSESNHTFGLRFDQTRHDPRKIVTLEQLRDKPASLDFRAGYEGMQSFKIHGVDYASQLIARANAEEDTAAEPEADTATEEGADTDTAAETAPGEEEKTGFAKTLSEVPLGVVIGGLLLIGILAGAGG